MYSPISVALVVSMVAVEGCSPKEGTVSEGSSGDTMVTESGSTTGNGGSAESSGSATGGATETGGVTETGGASATSDDMTPTGSEMTGDATDSEGAPGPEEACAAWCDFNVRCSDIPPDYCAMTCADDFSDGVRPGACEDAYVAFYLCVGGVASCDSADVDAACGEQQQAIDTSCR